jgi:type II secretory pathway pseudopilin PulG
MITSPITPARDREAGFTLVEMMITLGLTLIIMASTMGAMSNAIRAGEVATLTTNMNQGLRTAMDIMVRDMLQVGQGLPSGRTIDIPQGGSGTAIRIPGAPGTTRTLPTSASEMTAIIPGAGLGPTINGVATDVITIVLADGAFLSTISDYDVNLTALTATTMTVEPTVDISNGGADDLKVGDLIMLQKTTSTALVQITALDGAQTATFGAVDSLNLNQTGATTGTLTRHVATAPLEVAGSNGFVPSTATRIRMITYYLDNTTQPSRPRLVRRINNGYCLPDCHTAYNNNAGTAVAFDVENLQLTYDLVDGVGNPAEVEMTTTDQGTTGRCSPNPCSPNQIRKINIKLSGRSRTTMRQTRQFFRNTLDTQVSLRSMSFIDRYQ